MAESLAFHTPVITSDFGSTRETGEGNGALLIDPRDDAALVDAMRRLLLDDALLAKLREQTTMTPARSWRNYADEVWEHLVPGQSSDRAGDQPADDHPAGAEVGV